MNKKPRVKKRAVRKAKAETAQVLPCNEGYGNCARCKECRAAMRAAAAKFKGAQAWGIVMPNGRLVKDIMWRRVDAETVYGPGDSIIRVSILPLPPRTK